MALRRPGPEPQAAASRRPGPGFLAMTIRAGLAHRSGKVRRSPVSRHRGQFPAPRNPFLFPRLCR
jgi:hypothetical protein